MRKLTEAETLAFLVAQPRTAKLATVRPDGRPHVAPVWVDLDGELIITTTWHTSVKANNIRHDPRVCLCIDDEQPPYALAVVEGTAELIDDRELVLAWATQLAGRYLGPELAETFGKRNGVPGELLVRITPTKITGQSGIAD